ncbi:MAG: hypothetical protein IPN20_25130 [Haliscomenobacter sp.]|nr:hypothetical protein [Haliscomenobacter sp.]
MIFTTREYILNQAKSKYELFGRTIFFDKTKCIIDLSKYNKIVRAKILYNHIFFSSLPKAYVLELLQEKFYHELISHSNYNPRIIEVVIQSRIWENSKLSDFRKNFISFFNYPESIWKHAYDNHISALSRCMLALMFTASPPILYDDLLLLVQSFAKKYSAKYSISFSEKEFKRSLKELENTFISIDKDNGNQIAIHYQNPSVQDFLVNYLNTELDLVKDILESAIFINQFFRIFTFHEYYIIRGEKVKRDNQIILQGRLREVYFDKIMNELDYLNSSKILKIHRSSSTKDNIFRWEKRGYTESEKLISIINDLILDEHPEFKKYLKSRFLEFIHSDDFELDNEEIDAFINVFRIFKEDVQLSAKSLFESITKNFIWYQDLLSFKQNGGVLS